MKPNRLKYCFEKPIAITILFLLLVFPFSVFSQVNDGSFAYFNAMNLYNEGKVDSAHSLLNSYIANNKLFRKASKNTMADIYRLDALSCLLLDKPDEARLKIKEMLSLIPYYQNNFRRGDLLEFKGIIAQYTVRPKFILGVNSFKNYSTISLDKVFTRHNTNNNPNFISEYGLGFVAENALTKRFTLGLGIDLFKLHIVYEGGDVPFSKYDAYFLDFLYIETPTYLNYNLRIEKKLKPYFQIGLIGRYFLNNEKAQITNNSVQQFRSSTYGKYYMQNKNWDNNLSNGVLTLFFKNYENIDFIIGSGVSYDLKNSCLEFNIGYFPIAFNTRPLKGIDNIDDLPHEELFTWADDVIVIDLKRILRFSVSYKYYFSFKAY